MPINEEGEHQLVLGLPEGLRGDTACWAVRFTGEIFTDYEAYLQRVNQYRQRIWSCKYTSASGLTYEEAILSEQKVSEVVDQFPKLYEADSIRLVHHSVETAEQLCDSILAHFATHFVVGEQLVGTREDGSSASCVVQEVQTPAGQQATGAKQNGTAGSGDGADSEATEDEEEEGAGEQQAVDPDAVVYEVEWLGEGGAPTGQRASLRRMQLQRPQGSALAALTQPLLHSWVETVATAEPVAGVAGISCLWRVHEYWRQLYSLPEQLPPEMAERLRPARQKALHKVPSLQHAAGGGSDEEAEGGGEEGEAAEEYDPDEDEAELYHEVAAGSDFSDDDYRPMQPGMEARFKPMPARGRGRGRGRGRWGGRGGGAPAAGGYASGTNPAAAAFAAAAVAAASCGFPPSQQGSMGLLTAGSITGSAQLDGLGDASRQAAAAAASLEQQQRQQLEARQRATAEAAAKSVAKAERNNFKCPKCHRVTHPELSPLLLCDTCPRSFHQACLGLSDTELPSGDWCCPKCVDTTQAALRRVMDLETRRREASERAAMREKAAEDKMLKRMLQKEERERKKLEASGSRVAQETLRRVHVPQPDDWDILEEEKENLNRLEIRLRELQELAARVQQQQAAGAAGLGGQAPAFSAAEAEDLQLRVAEAAEALGKLQVIIQGPPTQFQALVTGEHAQAVLWQGLIATEFLKLYGDACEARAMGLQELYISLAWPLDNPELAKLLQQLLLCCLLEQMNHEPPERSRARRWARILTEGTWPEVCRRYLLATRAGKAKLREEGPEADAEVVSWQEDDEAALYLAHRLEATPWHRLPATCLLRLLNILCYDIAQGYALRNDINNRLQNITKITTERYREHAAERRAKREGDWAPAFGGGKKRRGGGGGKKGGKQAEPTEEELQAMAEEVEAEAMEDDGDDDAARFRLQRELQYDARLEATAMRTEPLGLDRHCRRYWWLHSDPGFLFVEEPDGQRIGVISTKEQLDEVISRLNRRGPRERQLHHNLRKKYAAICTRLAVESKMVYQLEGIARPQPLDPRLPQPAVEELEGRVARAALAETREKMEAFLQETQNVGVDLDGQLKSRREALAGACGDPRSLCDYLMQLEQLFCHAGEGLPKDADDATMAALLGEAVRPAGGIKAEEQDDAQGGNNAAAAADAAGATATPAAVKAEPGAEGEQQQQEAAGEAAGEAAPMDVDQAERDQQGAAPPAEAAAALRLHASGSSAALMKEESCEGEELQQQQQQAAAQPPAEAQQQQQAAPGLPPRHQSAAVGSAAAAAGAAAQKPPLHPSVAKLVKADSMQPSSAGVSQSGAEGGGTETEAGTTVEQEVQPLRPVSANDDMDDSDAEHAYLREKRMRRPARVWRSARERAVWLKMARTAETAEQAAYCAFILCDRADPMLKRVVQLAEEIAKWEAEEKERQRLEGLRAKRAEAGTPSMRPLMIRTGKAKTDEGVKIVLKAMGKEPFASGRNASTFETIASDEQIAECRWGYQCSVCLLAGDLLCCEHPDNCGVSVHLECTGMAFPSGPYICMNHDSRELKTRIRRRASSALAARDSGDVDEDEGGEEEEEEEGGSAGKRGGGAAARADADSEATVSEETQSLDSDATEDEGTSSRRKRKR